MNLDLDSLTEAVEQLWRAAISVSAIKYIAAGLVNNQSSGISINTEARKAKLHDQKAHDKKPENIINKLAAEICITIKENKNTNITKDNTTEEGMDDMVQTNDDLTPSSVCHRVTSPDTKSDFEDHHLTISMISHTNNDDQEPEQGDWTSFQVHQCQDQYLEPAATNNHDLFMSYAEPGEIFSEAELTGGNPNIDSDYETQTADETFNLSLNNTFEEDQIEVSSDFLHCSTPEPIEEDHHYFTSFVSHQLPFLAPQEEYQTFITSSVAHTCFVLEDDFSDPQTSIMSHYSSSFHDSGIFEDVNEEMTELTEDVIDEYTEYTNDEHLETIIEVSEICAESERTEDIEDFQVSMEKNDANNFILRSMTQDSIADIESEILELESLISRDFSSTSINIGEIDENTMEEENEMQVVTEAEKEILSKYEFQNKLEDEDLFSSMVSHSVLETEMDPEKLPSAASHVVIGLSEENDHNSMITHSPDHFEDLTKPETTDDYSEYTEVEHLDTIMEVSEMIDESEITEETEEIPISVDDYEMHVLRSMTQDSIADLHEEEEEITTEDVLNFNLIEEQQMIPISESSITVDEIVVENEDLHYKLSEDNMLYQAYSTMSTDYIEESKEDIFPSMVCHSVVDNEIDYDKLPSTAAHTVLGVVEENDYNSMLAHSHNIYGNPEFVLHQFYDISLAQEEHTKAIRYSRYGLLPDVHEENIGSFGTEEFHSFYPRIEDVEVRKNSMHDESLASMSSDIVSSIGLSEDYNEVKTEASLEPHVTLDTANDSNTIVDEEVVEDSMLPQLEEKSCPEKDEESAAEKSEPKPVVQSFKLQLTRLQQLQKLVEDELEEFDQKKNKVDLEQATETQIINIVKGVEFITNIKMNQVLEDSTQEHTTKVEHPIVQVLEEQEEEEQETTESIDTHEEKHNYEVFSEEEEAPEENFIHASCTLTENTVSIKSNYVNTSHSSLNEEIREQNIPEDQKQENILQDNDNNDENLTDMTKQKQDELKLQLRVPQRKSVSSETKIRDEQLLNSLFGGSNTAENVALNEKTEESKTRPSILKPSKSTVKVATATLNENVKKQSYRIKFKVKLNENKSKKETSVLRYLFGCFGGEKLFNSQHK